ncbi:venom serine protease inhibitor-like [Spea bombifrons]|uniref:venom serine protease inhibitor-like n=1 Tax=Spea bombifrons TaxID=233779 RepID=UPI00234B64E4|nr:venom serine protease inhibitor-like [Spea bombifrons]
MMNRIAVKLFLTLGLCLIGVSAQETARSQPDAFCEPNKIFYPCKPCPRSCGNVEIPCLKLCQPECYCKPGFVLSSPTSNTCIPESECTSCGPNGKFDDCNSHCQDTCDNYLQPNRACPMMCSPGCVCQKGFVMHNNQCIKPEACPRSARSFSPLLLPLLAGKLNITRQ